MSTKPGTLGLLLHPYREIVPLEGGKKTLREAARLPGSAVVWCLGEGMDDTVRCLVEGRAGGLSLIAVLPRAEVVETDPEVLYAVQRCRPQGLLPFHSEPDPGDLAQVLRRPPSDLAADVTAYLTWRGLGVDRDTVRLLRRIIELSAELRSITALSRSMYLSRRALGRRLMNRGLPVPSHWLQLGRLLRLTVRLQNSDASLFSIACDSGYPDGFSVSNQMYRLTGYRPSEVREYLGWEWLFEAWLRKEAEDGGLAPNFARAVASRAAPHGASDEPAPKPRSPQRRSKPRLSA